MKIKKMSSSKKSKRKKTLGLQTKRQPNRGSEPSKSKRSTNKRKQRALKRKQRNLQPSKKKKWIDDHRFSSNLSKSGLSRSSKKIVVM